MAALCDAAPSVLGGPETGAVWLVPLEEGFRNLELSLSVVLIMAPPSAVPCMMRRL